MPRAFGIVFYLIFAMVLAVFVLVAVTIAKAGVQKRREDAANAAAPVLNRPARVVAKRTAVTGGEKSTRTTYYATFEFPDGSREEFRLQGEAYGLLSEGDSGLLRTQGTWFHGFDRNDRAPSRRVQRWTLHGRAGTGVGHWRNHRA